MSSIAMAADSTQSESMRRHKPRAKLARQSKDESRKQKPYSATGKQVKVG